MVWSDKAICCGAGSAPAVAVGAESRTRRASRHRSLQTAFFEPWSLGVLLGSAGIYSLAASLLKVRDSNG
ncbi:unnamed protein product [Boreogadus saida]